MVNIFPLSDCLILTSSYEAIPEIMIKMQSIPAFGRKVNWFKGKPPSDVNKIVLFDSYSLKDLLLDLA